MGYMEHVDSFCPDCGANLAGDPTCPFCDDENSSPAPITEYQYYCNCGYSRTDTVDFVIDGYKCPSCGIVNKDEGTIDLGVVYA
jgi:hypothetical protein